MTSMTPTPILVDCDPGHDDAIALVMAHRSPAVELLGVTTTCGNAELEKTTANALRILEYIGAGDVPVAAGCHRPLARPASDHRHGDCGRVGALGGYTL